MSPISSAVTTNAEETSDPIPYHPMYHPMFKTHYFYLKYQELNSRDTGKSIILINFSEQHSEKSS